MLQVTQVTPTSLGYLILGGFVVLFSMVSLPLKERLYIGEVVLGTAFGIIMGPYCAGIFDPRSWGSTVEAENRITLEVMRIVLATGLFAIGVELPKAYLKEHARSLLIMVIPTMAFGWLVVAGIIRGLFPSLTYISALAISACLTPTDPVLSAAIIGGKFAVKNVPRHIRHLLSAESAANDGLAYPFLSISVYLAIEHSKGEAFGKWFLIGWLYQVILGTVIGALIGIAFSHLLKIAHRNGFIDRESLVAQYIALALFTIGIANTLGSDDLLAAFAAGSAVSWDGQFHARTEDEVFSSVIDLLLNCASFIYIGAWLPFETYNDVQLGLEPWRLVILFLAILVLRRIPSILLMYKSVPDIHNWREALFCGHFGPMGVGAIFISTLAVMELPKASSPPATQNELLSATLHPIVSFIVLGSIIIHGLSISAFWFSKQMLTLTRTMSRTFTIRTTQTTRGPDWLLFTRRASGTEVPSCDSHAGPIKQIPGDIESVGSTKGAEVTIGLGQATDRGASAHHRTEQELFRPTGVNFMRQGDHIGIGDTHSGVGLGEGHIDPLGQSGNEVAGFGLTALHNTKKNDGGDGRGEAGDEEKLEQKTDEDAPQTVDLNHAFGACPRAYDDERQGLGRAPGAKQVQFAK